MKTVWDYVAVLVAALFLASFFLFWLVIFLLLISFGG